MSNEHRTPLAYLVKVITPTLQALRAYWPAILLIQGISLCLVLSYYWIPSTQAVFGRIAELKVELGITFAAVTTAFSGCVFPELLKRKFRPKGSPAPSFGELVHQFMMWAIVGMLVDRFYTLQSMVFGHGNDVTTLVIKVVMDQLVFTPLLCVPFITLWFLVRETNYSPSRFCASVSLPVLRDRVLPIWATSLSFWPIMLLIVYSLPAALQFPLFLLGNSAFSILMIFIIRHQPDQSAAG
ncbi:MULTISPECIES: hypothetical protein [unclassified Lentimonas]|uniref:hypothetical protein n=1 Tax=unclassified Lentimonas TaxID=2630993 RepID=UPI0013262A31|nr:MULTISPECIES: hypothetical protein [unclassified Lentimonas]CAA6695460.1 Unannotated [Lentimonas sp. CC10]CAA6696629.1 Unannotated [Lentimonas sp. CC19]CAA7071291.1 Unannotated [Lentimonas sp. CC11]